jgi:hypothetical protein
MISIPLPLMKKLIEIRDRLNEKAPSECNLLQDVLEELEKLNKKSMDHFEQGWELGNLLERAQEAVAVADFVDQLKKLPLCESCIKVIGLDKWPGKSK